MSADAFARLMSGRIEELDADLDTLATDADLDPALVRSWASGSALPEDDQIRPLAKHLSLPRSLLREARRVAEASRMSASDEPTDTEFAALEVFAEPAVAESEERDSTMEQVIAPSVMVEDLPSEPPPGLEPDAMRALDRVLELIRSPVEVLSARMERRRARALAPTEQPSYVEDDGQRTTYQLRAIFTAGGVIALALILRWALSGFGSSLADLWDTLTSTL